MKKDQLIQTLENHKLKLLACGFFGSIPFWANLLSVLDLLSSGLLGLVALIIFSLFFWAALLLLFCVRECLLDQLGEEARSRSYSGLFYALCVIPGITINYQREIGHYPILITLTAIFIEISRLIILVKFKEKS